MSMVLKASPASNPFNPLRGSESFLSSSESRKMPSWTHNKSSQEQPSGVVWCVCCVPYAYGTYHMRIRIWYDRTRMVWLFVPYAYIAILYYYCL